MNSEWLSCFLREEKLFSLKQKNRRPTRPTPPFWCLERERLTIHTFSCPCLIEASLSRHCYSIRYFAFLEKGCSSAGEGRMQKGQVPKHSDVNVRRLLGDSSTWWRISAPYLTDPLRSRRCLQPHDPLVYYQTPASHLAKGETFSSPFAGRDFFSWHHCVLHLDYWSLLIMCSKKIYCALFKGFFFTF